MRLALKLGDSDPRDETDSVFRTNAAIRDLLAESFEITGAEDADLVVSGDLTVEPPVGPPHVVLAHGAVLDPGHWSRTIPRLRRQDTLVVTSRSDEAVVSKLAGDPFCRVARLPLFVDTSFFRPSPELRRSARVELGIDRQTNLLLTASVVVAEKNVHGAIHLLTELTKLRPDVELAIAGSADDEYRAYLLDLAARHGVAGRVRLLGQLTHPELLLAYNAADVFVHLGWLWKENFGLAVVEAQACGLPVVAASWDGFRDTVLDAQTGYLADTWLVSGGRRVHWPSLVPRCRELLDDRVEWGARARRHALDDYSPARFHDRLVTLVREAAAPTSASGGVTLSAMGRALALCFEICAREHPQARSKHVEQAMRAKFPEAPEVTAIHRLLASRDAPPPWTPGSAVHALVDATRRTAGQWTIEEPPFRREVSISPVADWVLRQVAQGPMRLEELRARVPGGAIDQLESALSECGHLGLAVPGLD